jgi:hypothetical protein
MYRAARRRLIKVRANTAVKVERADRSDDFSPAPVMVDRTSLPPLSFDEAAWQRWVRDASAIYLRYPSVHDSAVQITATDGRRWLASKPRLPELAQRRLCQGRNLRPLQTCSHRKTAHQPPALARLLLCGPADAVLQGVSYPGRRSILAPSARSLSSIRSYPRSMCRTL